MIKRLRTTFFRWLFGFKKETNFIIVKKGKIIACELNAEAFVTIAKAFHYAIVPHKSEEEEE